MKSSFKFFPVFHFGQKFFPPPGGGKWPEYISLSVYSLTWLSKEGYPCPLQVGRIAHISLALIEKQVPSFDFLRRMFIICVSQIAGEPAVRGQIKR